MSHLQLVALIVRDYDAAIQFFVEVLQFELVEDTPSLTNDGRPKRWVVVRPAGGQTGILLARADGEQQLAASAGSSPVASACSCASTTSMPPTSAWPPLACSSSRRRARRRTGAWSCSWISRGTSGISWGRQPRDDLLMPGRPRGLWRPGAFRRGGVIRWPNHPACLYKRPDACSLPPTTRPARDRARAGDE